jgi:aminoglycoside 6'-N-acetyltransferase
MRGQGLGSAFLRLRAIRLIAEGAPIVAIDPGAVNRRARRAFARGGFIEIAVVPTDRGPVALSCLSPRT